MISAQGQLWKLQAGCSIGVDDYLRREEEFDCIGTTAMYALFVICLQHCNTIFRTSWIAPPVVSAVELALEVG